MSGRANKTSTVTPRRTSERKAKTKALSSLSNKENIIPTNTRKSFVKKRLKDKREQQPAPPILTLQRGLPVVVHQAGKSNTEIFKSRTETLADIDVEGAFLLNELAHPASSKTPPSVKKIKIVTKAGKEKSTDPFPINLFQMMEWSSVEYPSVCRWSPDGRSIEIDSKNPTMLLILRQFFKHSRWLSFSRQLNNYGFVSLPTNAKNFKIIRHPYFRRSIPDPKDLVYLLPYLPGVRKRQGRKATSTPVDVPSKTKQTKRIRVSKSPKAAPVAAKTVTPLANAKKSSSSSVLKTISASSSEVSIRGTKKSKKRSTTKGSRGLQMRPRASELPGQSPGAKSSSELKTISASSSEVSIKSTKKSKKRYPTRSTRGLQVTPRANQLSTQATKKRKKTNQVNNYEHHSDVGFLKTPSPQRRSTKAPFMSSPPPLSHYLQPKIHPAPNATADLIKMGAAAAAGKLLSSNGSPLPSSLLTVNFDMTPSSLKKNDERTPRASNLSSSACSPSSSQDGFHMLSWAAQAVESPDLNEMQKYATSEFMKSICSPIVSAKKKQRNNQRCNMKRVGSTSTLGSSIMGPSPLSLRERQESLSELELLRNCLEDVFVTTGAGGNAAVPHYFASV